MTTAEIENAKANLQYDGEAKLSAKYYRSLAIRLLTELEKAQKEIARLWACGVRGEDGNVYYTVPQAGE